MLNLEVAFGVVLKRLRTQKGASQETLGIEAGELIELVVAER